MVIHVIHNPERTERFERLMKQKEEHNLELMLWPAIMDKQVPFRGVCQAHKQIIRFAMRNKLSRVCIAEDDFKLTAKGAWEYFIGNIPKDFDIYLSGIYFGHIKEDNTVDDFCALHLYIVNESFYQKFLDITEMDNIDRQMGKHGKCVVCEPFTAVQFDGWSDNKQAYGEYEKYLVGRKLFGVGEVSTK